MSESGKSNQYKAEELDAFLCDYSSAMFEIEIMQMIDELIPNHSYHEHYVDHYTKKFREYDFRGKIYNKKVYLAGEGLKTFNYIGLSIECKNLYEGSPIVVTGISDEKHHWATFIKSHSVLPGTRIARPGILDISKSTAIKSMFGLDYILYCGIELIQPQRKGDKKNSPIIKASSSDIYGKWSQAVSSSIDMAKEFLDTFPTKNDEETSALFVPIMVVPEDSLWLKPFDMQTDCREGEIQHAEAIKMRFGLTVKELENYNISHYQIVTPKGLDKLLRFLLEK